MLYFNTEQIKSTPVDNSTVLALSLTSTENSSFFS